MTLTIGQFLAFFAKKGKGKYTKTKEYLERYGPKGPYYELVKTFWDRDREQALKEDISFYRWLDEKKKSHFAGLQSLSALMQEDPDFAETHAMADKLKKDDPLLQKWHLYISWAAGRESNLFPQKGLNLENSIVQFKCPELLLWMCEAAGVKQIDSFYKRLISIKERERIVDDDLRSWISETNKAIKETILHSAKEEQSI